MQNHLPVHCWQHQIRLKNLAYDLQKANLSYGDKDKLRVSDFQLSFVPNHDIEMCHKVRDFITDHEWLGKMHRRPTQRFIATFNGHIAGAIVMSTPNTFSNFIGKANRDKEKLISRGACISWSPKNLGSALLMYSIRWMVQNTRYRVFSGYSDPVAGEIGTIYQACNFIYLGQCWGVSFKYFDPHYPEKGCIPHRLLTKICTYKEIAAENDILWHKDWSYRDQIFWEKIPHRVARKIKDAPRVKKERCHRIKVPRKHKYIYLLGRSKRETVQLHKLLHQYGPKINLPYPKRNSAEILLHAA